MKRKSNPKQTLRKLWHFIEWNVLRNPWIGGKNFDDYFIDRIRIAAREPIRPPELPVDECSWCVNVGMNQIFLSEVREMESGKRDASGLSGPRDILAELNERYHGEDSPPHPYEYEQPFDNP